MCHALLQWFWFRDNKFSWEFWCKNYGCGLCLIVWNCKYLNVGTHLFGMNTILWYMYVLVCIYKVWDEWICMSDVIHGLWMMNLDKSWHAISMKWLVIYVVMNSVWTIMLHWWHGIGMRWSSISPNWEEWDGMKSTWNMNEDGLQRMAWGVKCMINIICLFGMWLVCCQYVNPRVSRWDFLVVLQWSGRNSMTPVSGCPWWCPIYITW